MCKTCELFFPCVMPYRLMGETCIFLSLSLLNHIAEFDSSSGDDSDSGSDFVMGTTVGENLCIPALGYLKRCAQILQTMWKMPACPVFNCAKR